MKKIDWLRQHIEKDISTCTAWPFPLTLLEQQYNRPFVACSGRNGSVPVARAILIMTTGEDRDGEVARHICRRSWCITKDHIVWGTREENDEDERGRHVGPRRTWTTEHASMMQAMLAEGFSKNAVARKFELKKSTDVDRIISRHAA